MILIHVYSWTAALILFAASFFFMMKKQEKALKITQMILRLAYLSILGTGLHLLAIYQFMGIIILKSLLGILVIGTMEMVLVRGKKGKPIKLFVLLFVITLVLTLFMGYHVI